MAITLFRVSGSAFCATRYATVPSPWPSFPEVISSHGAWDAADQLHSRATPTAICPVPPVGPEFEAEPEIAGWQRVAVGDVTVTLVDAELPQPASTNAALAANSRGRIAQCTSVAHSRHAPSRDSGDVA